MIEDCGGTREAPSSQEFDLAHVRPALEVDRIAVVVVVVEVLLSRDFLRTARDFRLMSSTKTQLQLDNFL